VLSLSAAFVCRENEVRSLLQTATTWLPEKTEMLFLGKNVSMYVYNWLLSISTLNPVNMYVTQSTKFKTEVAAWHNSKNLAFLLKILQKKI
jgi:hypothetical protein